MKSSGALAILQKEFMHMARDPSTILFALLPPIFQVIAFGFAIDTDVRNLSTIVCNQDGRQASRALIDQFENTGTFQIKEYAHSSEALFRALVEGRYMVGLHIPPDFS
ncbi:MAG: ABC transporter permease, partial [bacterium]|nr:ABC transporter permease [bacterium]